MKRIRSLSKFCGLSLQALIFGCLLALAIIEIFSDFSGMRVFRYQGF